MATNEFDPNTGKRLKKGQTVTIAGTNQKITQGTQFVDPYDTNDGGAAGKFDSGSNTLEEQNARANFDEAVIRYGGSRGESILNANTAKKLANQYKLTNSAEFVGLTSGQAAQLAQAKRSQQDAQTSTMTSYTFNPESISGTKKAVDQFQLSLESITNDPYKVQGDKNDSKINLLESTANDIAKNFNTAQEFYDAYNNNAELQKSMDAFIKAGGTQSQIASKVTTATNDILPEQDTATYLANITTGSSPASLKAIAALAPEAQISQQEIMRQNGIAQQLKDAYFGTPEQIGILEKQKIDAENQKAIYEAKELSDSATLREKAQYQIDKNNSDVAIAQAEIETNRINAKNYMTGMLAKLGALQTTGAAPLALTTLEQKYQQQKQQLDTKLKFANRLVQINLTDDINNIENARDQKIQDINEDITKNEATALKEILKATNDANSRIYTISSGYASKLREQTDKYTAEAKANADKYISSFSTLAGKGLNLKQISSMIDANGRLIPSQALANALAPKAKDEPGDLPSGIGKPTFTGERLSFGTPEVDDQGNIIESSITRKAREDVGNLEKVGIVSSDIIQVQKLLDQGYSLKAIAKSTKMPTTVYNALNKYIVKGGEE